MSIFSIVKSIACSALCTMLIAGAAGAAEQGTASEAEAMVKKAVAHIKAVGAEKAYDEFTTGKTFKDRDLYIVVYDLNGKNLAHGANARLVGKEMMGMKDPDGVPVIKMFVDTAREKGKGWTDSFKFVNPVTQKLQSKVLYVERVGDTLVGCGVYKL